MKSPQRLFTTAALTVAVLAWPLGLVRAAEKGAVDPSGTWKITRFKPGTTNQIGSAETLKLKLETGKLTGTITGRSSINGKVKIFEWPVKDTKLDGDDIAFTVTHAPVVGQGPDSTTIFEGRMKGDGLKGKANEEWSGYTLTRDFEARRLKE